MLEPSPYTTDFFFFKTCSVPHVFNWYVVILCYDNTRPANFVGHYIVPEIIVINGIVINVLRQFYAVNII